MTTARTQGPVLWDIDARGVATVVLNRPDVNNAYNGDLIQGLHDAMDALGRERSLRIVVLKGNGRHFQAGADLGFNFQLNQEIQPNKQGQNLSIHIHIYLFLCES